MNALCVCRIFGKNDAEILFFEFNRRQVHK